MSDRRRARVLVVAGHDPSYRGPSGGAGVDADREALERQGVEAVCVVTAWTEQDGAHVHALRPRAPEDWLAEARLAAREPVQALKSGLLPAADAVRALATLVDELRRDAPELPVVVDPVLAATGGEPFLDEPGLASLLSELLPRRVILTPNLPEAARLTGLPLARLQTDRAARLDAARSLLARGARAVLLKGGHATDDPAQDLCLEHDAPPLWLPHPRLPGARLHGSGCRHASTVAAILALGAPLPTAARTAGTTLQALLHALPTPSAPARPHP